MADAQVTRRWLVRSFALALASAYGHGWLAAINSGDSKVAAWLEQVSDYSYAATGLLAALMVPVFLDRDGRR